jgi:hypothetical protein
MRKGGLILKHRYILACLLALSIIFGFSSLNAATVDWEIPRTFNLETPPVDVAMSSKGTWIFVLDDQGEILIYSSRGNYYDKIAVGNQVDQIEAGPLDELLVLKSRKNKTVQLLVLDFIKTIDISGSPFKGPADAPVTIAVFSDFQ